MSTKMAANANTIAENDWRKEFIHIRRIPRTGRRYIEELLEAFMEPEVSLQEKKHCTLIVLKFPVSTQKLKKQIRNVYSKNGITIKDVFAEVLLRKPKENESTLLSQFGRIAYRAYSEAWFRFEQLLYVDRLHPDIDEALRASLKEFRSNIAPSLGRRKATAERLSRKRRFQELLADCKEIHNIVKNRSREKFESPGTRITAIRKTVFGKICGKRYAKDVLSLNDLWPTIPYGADPHRLHEQTSWEPHQLALALLARECGKSYQTIEKQIRYTANPARYTGTGSRK